MLGEYYLFNQEAFFFSVEQILECFFVLLMPQRAAF